MGTSSGACEINHECANMSDLITRTRTSTHMFSNVPHHFFGKACVDMMSFG